MRNIYVYIILLTSLALYSCHLGGGTPLPPRALPSLADGSCEAYESTASQFNTMIHMQPAIYPQASLDDQHVTFNYGGTDLYIFYVVYNKADRGFDIDAEYDSREFPYNSLYLVAGIIDQDGETDNAGYGPLNGKVMVFPMQSVSAIESNHILNFKANYEILESSDYGNPNAKAIQSGTFSFTCNYIHMDDYGNPISYRKLRKTHAK